jgi:general stress protein 26
MAGLRWVGKELWIACALKSRKVRDLRARSWAEICFMDKSCNHVRIAGRCKISASPRDRSVLLKLMPFLKNYVSGPDDPDYAVIRLRPSSIRWMPFTEMKYHEVLGKTGPKSRARR